MSKTNLDEIIGLCRICGRTLGESPPPACADCTGPMGSRRSTNTKESDPYRKIWNSVEDEETALCLSAKNGTLFMPTYEELGRRHVSTAKYLLTKARKLGRSAAGLAYFEEALIQRKFAKDMFDSHREVVKLSR